MAAPSSAPPGAAPPLPPDRAAGSTRAKTQLGLDPDTAALIFPSPHEVGRRCPGGADEGLFLRETRWQSRRRFVVVQSTLRQPKSPSSAPPGHLLPVEGRGEGKMGGSRLAKGSWPYSPLTRA